jgi:hypothetical protein
VQPWQATDFSKFPYPSVARPEAATLAEAIAYPPTDAGFVVITLKAQEPEPFVRYVRDFARGVRDEAPENGLTEITAYRQLRRDELGGSIPFDQAICEKILAIASGRGQSRAAVALVESIVLTNPHVNWILFLEYRTPALAAAAACRFRASAVEHLRPLTLRASDHTVGAFKNLRRYAAVSRDPNAIHFFNLFGAPGDPEVLWTAWQEALPWFFEVAEFRSSFPLLALDPQQPLLLVNYAHTDSTKHFLIGTLYDPTFQDVMRTCYFERGVVTPAPFFCKIVPV